MISFNKHSPQKEKKWAKKYHGPFHHYSQDFAAEVVKIFKPKFYPGFVHLKDKQLIGSKRLN